MKTTIKLLLLLIAASILYCLESFRTDQTGHGRGLSMFRSPEGESLYIAAYDKALKLWRVNYEELNIKTSYGTAHVTISGPESGSPLVLLHGMNASSTMWYPNAKDLSAKYRIYAIDMIKEPGKSILQKDITTTEALIKWYDEVFDGLHLGAFSIAGASRGGWIACQLALHSGKTIKKLVLLSPAQTFIAVKPKPKVVRNAFFALLPERALLRQDLKTLSWDVDRLEPDYVDQYFTCLQNMKVNTEFMQMDVYSDKELKSLRIPVLVLIGDHDIFNTEKSIERARQTMAFPETAVIHHAGHFITFDQAQEVNQRILAFLDKK
jgi:pimeloyl-ACP methyl ester carboxylesterase